MAREQERLAPDRVPHAVIAADHAGEPWRAAEEGRAGALQRGEGPLPGAARGGQIDHDAGVAVPPVGRVQLEHGIGVGQAGGLVGGHDQQRVGPCRHPAHGPVEPGAEIEQDRVIA